VDVWIDRPSDEAPVKATGDVEWPTPHEVYVSVAEPGVAAEPLTLAESAQLAQMDSDIDAVIEREYQQSLPVQQVPLPRVLSASMLMRMADDPATLALDLARPMPRVSSEAALAGTTFHEWVAASQEQLSLLPEWELTADTDRVDDTLAELIAGYRRTPYAQMVPAAVETEVTLEVAGLVVRGIIDAVFQHPDGTWEVVDWKTNRAHDADPLQLAIYRLGWAQRVGVSPEEVMTAFVYVRDAEVVRPEMPDLHELTAALSSQAGDR
jgi:DNA helicase-2/ATP-dependent DNA helicase PcrA